MMEASPSPGRGTVSPRTFAGCFTALLLWVIITGGCSSRTDLSPAATVGSETVSRACLKYAREKNPLSGKTEEETLRSLVNQLLLAKAAVEEGIHRTPVYARLSGGEIESARRDFLCGEFGVRGDCGAGLMAVLGDGIGMKMPRVEWESLFPRERRAAISLGGKIPDAPGTSGPGSAGINWKYAGAVNIPSRLGDIPLSKILASVPGKRLDTLARSPGEARNVIIRDIIVDAFSGLLASSLPAPRRELLVEIEKRADEHLLASLYRESLGHPVPVPSGIAVRTLPVSETEARAYYDARPGEFQEPVWVELSHIRVRDYASALEVRRRLAASPGSFCGEARRSLSPDGTRCGRLGKITRRRNLPLHLDYAFTMKEDGEISDPVKTPEGWEIVKLHRRGTVTLPFKAPHTRRLVAEKMRPHLVMKAVDRSLREMAKKHPVRFLP